MAIVAAAAAQRNDNDAEEHYAQRWVVGGGGTHSEAPAAGSGIPLVVTVERQADPEAGALSPEDKTGRTRGDMDTGWVDAETGDRSGAGGESGERVQRWAKLGIDQGRIGMHRHPRS